jgi:hypothetical protein
MAIVFTKQKRSQRVLIIFSVLMILVSAIVLWWAFLREEAPYVPSEIALPSVKSIEINFEALEKAKEFQPFTEIQPLQEVAPTEGEDGSPGITIGRENPFLPY